jgi:hypothetical protein
VVDECVATTANEKSERRNAASSTANAATVSPATAYIARRPEAAHARSRVRAARTDARTP